MHKLLDTQYEGFKIMVDAEDYERLSRHKWFIKQGYTSKSVIKIIRHGDRYKNESTHVKIANDIMDIPEGMYPVLKDRNFLNYTKENIILVDKETMTYYKHPRADNVTGYKGVSKTIHETYRAVISINGTQISLGYHDTAEDAAKAYNKAVIDQFGEDSGVFVNTIGIDNRFKPVDFGETKPRHRKNAKPIKIRKEPKPKKPVKKQTPKPKPERTVNMNYKEQNEAMIENIKLLMIDVLEAMKTEVELNEGELVANTLYNSVAKVLNEELDKSVTDEYPLSIFGIKTEDLQLDVNTIIGTSYFAVYDEGEEVFTLKNFIR